MSDALEAQAQRLEALAHDLERACAHAATAAAHLRAGEVPRGCAHTVALQGHLRDADDRLGEVLRRHAAAATP